MSIENIDKLITLCGELHTLTDKLIARCDKALDLLRRVRDVKCTEDLLELQPQIDDFLKLEVGKKRGLTNLTGGE